MFSYREAPSDRGSYILLLLVYFICIIQFVLHHLYLKGQSVISLPSHRAQLLLAAVLGKAQLFRQPYHTLVAAPCLGVQLVKAQRVQVCHKQPQRMGRQALAAGALLRQIDPDRQPVAVFVYAAILIDKITASPAHIFPLRRTDLE